MSGIFFIFIIINLINQGKSPTFIKAHQDQTTSTTKLQAQMKQAKIRKRGHLTVHGSISEDTSFGNSWLDKTNNRKLLGLIANTYIYIYISIVLSKEKTLAIVRDVLTISMVNNLSSFYLLSLFYEFDCFLLVFSINTLVLSSSLMSFYLFLTKI
jgi:hypothetical protein